MPHELGFEGFLVNLILMIRKKYNGFRNYMYKEMAKLNSASHAVGGKMITTISTLQFCRGSRHFPRRKYHY